MEDPPSFHVKLLEPHRQRRGEPRSDVEAILNVMEDLLLPTVEVEKIMDSRLDEDEDQVEYLVRWRNHPKESQWTWEPYESFIEKDCLRKFHRESRNKPRDERLD